jgi:hypothetical protein
MCHVKIVWTGADRACIVPTSHKLHVRAATQRNHRSTNDWFRADPPMAPDGLMEHFSVVKRGEPATIEASLPRQCMTLRARTALDAVRPGERP